MSHIAKLICFTIAITNVISQSTEEYDSDNADKIEIIDLTYATVWKDLANYYTALERRWKICVNCGTPNLGTSMHLEHTLSVGSMHTAVIPPEYLTTKLLIVDVTAQASSAKDFVLTLDMALQFIPLRRDPKEPTLLLFKFGWKEDDYNYKAKNCVCKIPGISYELAEWISANMSHVVGVATDAPTLESEQTREFSSRTVSNLLGRSGVYMIENVNMKKRVPEHGCMVIAMPLKLLNMNYVPARVTAYCPIDKTDLQVTISLKDVPEKKTSKSRIYDVNLEEILN